MDLSTLPYLETVVSTIAAFILGIVWYHPKVMGERWVAARGCSLDEMKNFPRKSVLISFFLWLLAAFFYSFLVSALQINSWDTMFSLSCLLWVAFAMPPILMGSLFTGYPFQAAAIDAAYQLAGYYMFAATHFVLSFLG
ncbi:MAG: DUF1761 domain-containing protein [Rhodospirillales bacterium]|nr:DUF1761 domain-containing protein [Rhodospirillales bacterium]